MTLVEAALTDFYGIVQDPGTKVLSKLSDFGGNDWNAMLASADSIESSHSQRCGITCKISAYDCSKRRHHVMIGFVSAPGDNSRREVVAGNPSFQTLTYAAYGAGSGFQVFEKGTNIGQFGGVRPGDVVVVALNSETPPKMEYRVNGQIRYTSRVPVVYPLVMKVCAYSQGPLIEELRWITDVDDEVPPSPFPDLSPKNPLKNRENVLVESVGEDAEEPVPVVADKQALVASYTTPRPGPLSGDQIGGDDRVKLLERALRAAITEKTQLEVDKMELQVQNDELRRRLLLEFRGSGSSRSSEVGSEDWERVGASVAGAA